MNIESTGAFFRAFSAYAQGDLSAEELSDQIREVKNGRPAAGDDADLHVEAMAVGREDRARLNNDLRREFFEFVADRFDGSANIPDCVADVMKLDDFGGLKKAERGGVAVKDGGSFDKGHPLSPKRVATVLNAMNGFNAKTVSSAQMQTLRDIAGAAIGSREGLKGGAGYMGIVAPDGEPGKVVKFLTHHSERKSDLADRLPDFEILGINAATEKLLQTLKQLAQGSRVEAAVNAALDAGTESVSRANGSLTVKLLKRSAVAKAVALIAATGIRDGETGAVFHWNLSARTAATQADTTVSKVFDRLLRPAVLRKLDRIMADPETARRIYGNDELRRIVESVSALEIDGQSGELTPAADMFARLQLKRLEARLSGVAANDAEFVREVFHESIVVTDSPRNDGRKCLFRHDLDAEYGAERAGLLRRLILEKADEILNGADLTDYETFASVASRIHSAAADRDGSYFSVIDKLTPVEARRISGIGSLDLGAAVEEMTGMKGVRFNRLQAVLFISRLAEDDETAAEFRQGGIGFVKAQADRIAAFRPADSGLDDAVGGSKAFGSLFGKFLPAFPFEMLHADPEIAGAFRGLCGYIDELAGSLDAENPEAVRAKIVGNITQKSLKEWILSGHDVSALKERCRKVFVDVKRRYDESAAAFVSAAESLGFEAGTVKLGLKDVGGESLYDMTKTDILSSDGVEQAEKVAKRIADRCRMLQFVKQKLDDPGTAAGVKIHLRAISEVLMDKVGKIFKSVDDVMISAEMLENSIRAEDRRLVDEAYGKLRKAQAGGNVERMRKYAAEVILRACEVGARMIRSDGFYRLLTASVPKYGVDDISPFFRAFARGVIRSCPGLLKTLLEVKLSDGGLVDALSDGRQFDGFTAGLSAATSKLYGKMEKVIDTAMRVVSMDIARGLSAVTSERDF